MYPVAYGHSRRELTPVRLCSVRLSWRQRARPSTTLHEIQICRSRLEYFVCTTAAEGPQLRGMVRGSCIDWAHRAECTWTGCGSEGVSGEDLMKTYLKFAASFWMRAFLATASMAAAQTTTTTPMMMVGPDEEMIPVPQQKFWIRRLAGRYRARPGRRRRGRTLCGESHPGSQS
jgi:hypothetical protein